MKMIKAAVLVHTVINSSAAFYFFINGDLTAVKGAAAGMLLASIFGIYKLSQMRKMLQVDPRDSVRIMMFGLLLRFFLMTVFFFFGHFVLRMDLVVFALTFVFGMMVNIIAEVWHMNTMKKETKS